jgi:nicotinamide riboside kinase
MVEEDKIILPHERGSFLEYCLTALKSRNRPFVLLKCTWEEPFQIAVKETNAMLKNPSR